MTVMERGKLTFSPEWLKVANGGVTGSANSNHHARSSTHSGEHGVGHSSRSSLLNASDHQTPRSSAFPDRSLSSCRSSSSKDTSAYSHAYSSFGRSRRDRDREKDLDFHDRDRSLSVDNGSHDFSDSFIATRADKDNLRRSQSMLSGRRAELLPKRPGSDANVGVLSGGKIVSGISKASFERDFPSLGAEEKQGLPDIGRVSSPGLSTAVQSIPIGSLALAGGSGWTSALAEAPSIVVGNGPEPSSSLQDAPENSASTAPSTVTGLNMAETLAQAPSRVRTAPLLSVEIQRLEELTLKQFRQLIPVTPSMPKTLVLNTSISEKPKPKGARGGDFSALPKVGQQSSSQLVNHALRVSPRSDIPKISQPGNFQVLERNGISPTSKDGPSLPNGSRVLNLLGPSAAVPPLKSLINQKLKADSKGGASSSTQGYLGEKRPLSQAQKRNDFFNGLRKKTSMNHSNTIPEPSCVVSSSSLERAVEQITVAAAIVGQVEESSASNTGSECLMGNGNSATGNFDSCEQHERFLPDNEEKISCSDDVVDPDEKEAAFLRSLGWKEDSGEDALTAEEIDSFVKQYEKIRPSSKLCNRDMQRCQNL